MDLIDFFNKINEEIFENKWKVYCYSGSMSIKCSNEAEFFGMMEKVNIVIKEYLYYNIKLVFDLERLRISIMGK